MEKSCWRPRRDSNPRYRRESVTAPRIYNNLDDTDGTVSHWKYAEERWLVYQFVYHATIEQEELNQDCLALLVTRQCSTSWTRRANRRLAPTRAD